MASKAFVVFLGGLLFVLLRRTADASPKLQVGYYNSTCPKAEETVRRVVVDWHRKDPKVGAGLLRLHFHDCFVRGCEASVLLDETASGDTWVEKSEFTNSGTLNGLETIDAAKSALESDCPDTVSCADILAFAARDAIVLAGFEDYAVPSGRRDGSSSWPGDVGTSIPQPMKPNGDIQILTEMFHKKGFSLREIAVLSGAHSIGGAHCINFDTREDVLNGKSSVDVQRDDTLLDYTDGPEPHIPTDANYTRALKKMCQGRGSGKGDEEDLGPKVDFDPVSPLKLDNSYYVRLQKGQGLLMSDNTLMEDEVTRAAVNEMAKDQRLWEREFIEAMIKLGKMEVLVGADGEIRKNCRFINK
ncbi:peroxidase 5-like [Typha latifolia]|uniref:peroxidase 5-like n=1 Tax=Typha latifolia TaxID=4733 RepID=UPI003C2F4C19